jgi:cytochrome c biogenesis protein CcdA
VSAQEQLAKNREKLLLPLLLVLIPISLFDSTSMIPLCVIPLAVILKGNRPLAGAWSFLCGIFLVYAGGGLLLLFGLDAVFDLLAAKIERWWTQPNSPELFLQIAIGVVMFAFAWKIARARERSAETSEPESLSPHQGFMIGAGLTLVGLPGAFPYIGAIDQILRADPGFVRSILALLFYNLVVLLPLVALVIIRFVFPAHSETVFQWVGSVADRWGHRIVVTALALLGAVLVVDGVGWLRGYPLIPI